MLTVVITHYIYIMLGGDASMTGIAESQTAESLAAFQAGSKRKNNTFDLTPLTNNIYANKKRKITSDNSTLQKQRKQDEDDESFRRGRYGFDNLGILRTKPGKLFIILFNVQLSLEHLINCLIIIPFFIFLPNSFLSIHYYRTT